MVINNNNNNNNNNSNITSAGRKEISTRECMDRLAAKVYPLGACLVSGIYL
jgi:hypothetical protein